MSNYNPVIMYDSQPFLSKVTQVKFEARYVPVLSRDKLERFAAIRVELFDLEILYLEQQQEYIIRAKSVISSMSDVDRAVELLTIPDYELLPEHVVRQGERFIRAGARDISTVTFVGKVGNEKHGYFECVGVETHYIIQGTVIEFFGFNEFRARFGNLPTPLTIRHLTPLPRG